MNKRPLGITVLASLGFLGAAFYVVVMILAVTSGDTLRRLLESVSGGGVGPAPLLRLGALLPVYFLVAALVSAGMGWGLWKLKNWAWIIALVLTGLSLIIGGIEIGRALPQPMNGVLVSALVRMAVALLVFWYLCTARVRTAFRQSAPG